MQNITAKSSIDINAPATAVWEALTTPEPIKKYFMGADVKTDWQVGSPIEFNGTWEGKSFQEKGTILEVIPNRSFRYTNWSSMSGIEDKPENYVAITYTLNESKDSTTLTITQENISDETKKAQSEETWSLVLKEIKAIVEQQTVSA
ncbi:MAG: SRPBCC domain-containing protein [Cyclobacteriaceae bacterium]|nr:SRPBCC domain-containing protein [Cyclobacteriaceae bacterium]